MAKRKFNGQTKNVADASTVALPDLSKMADTDKVTIVSESRASKKIIGIGKMPVVFDKDGKAEVTAKEAKYFLSIEGFELDEVESEAPSGSENTEGENSGAGNETPAVNDNSEKSEDGKDDSKNTTNASTGTV